MDLSRQTNTSIPQKINFLEKLKDDNGAIIIWLILLILDISSIRLNYWRTQLLNLHQIKLMEL